MTEHYTDELQEGGVHSPCSWNPRKVNVAFTRFWSRSYTEGSICHEWQAHLSLHGQCQSPVALLCRWVVPLDAKAPTSVFHLCFHLFSISSYPSVPRRSAFLACPLSTTSASDPAVLSPLKLSHKPRATFTFQLKSSCYFYSKKKINKCPQILILIIHMIMFCLICPSRRQQIFLMSCFTLL